MTPWLKETGNAMQAMINTVNRGRVPPSTDSVLIASPSDGPAPLSVLDEAIALHQVWKDTFMAAVTTGDLLDVGTIKRDDCCALGRWIHAEGRARYGAKPELVALFKRHKEFHDVCGIVAIAINGREYADAEKIVGRRSQFAYASIEVEVAIMKLRMAVAG